MASFKPAYLIHGDDHGRISERRSRLRVIGEAQSGPQGIELLEGEEATAERAAYALSAMTFAIGRRFIIVDGAERWKEKELEPLEAALGAMPPDTTIAFFAREDSRLKAPKRLHEAVGKAEGQIDAEQSVKPWELPKWVIKQAAAMQVSLEPDAARALIQKVGDRQQRLLRELEKLALGAGPGTSLDAAEVQEQSAASAEHRAWSLADALVGGEARNAIALYLGLRAQGERVPGLLYWMGQRVRLAHDVARAIEAGEPVAQIKRGLRMPGRAADRLIADARRSGAEKLRQAIIEIADLELSSRGGGSGGASEDTSALLALRRIAA